MPASQCVQVYRHDQGDLLKLCIRKGKTDDFNDSEGDMVVGDR